MTLESAPCGDPVVIETSDLASIWVRRLAELGLRIGTVVVPLHRTAGGGRVVGVGDARVAVAGAALRRISVRPDAA